jgi:hypothetical protein
MTISFEISFQFLKVISSFGLFIYMVMQGRIQDFKLGEGCQEREKSSRPVFTMCGEPCTIEKG